MSKKHNHIDQLSPELFNAYQEGSLSADEMYAVEKYLLDNPFEAEALEGLETLAPEALDGHLQDLHIRLDQKLSEKTATKVVFWTMTRRLAASLLIIVTAGLVYFLPGTGTTIGTKELSENTKELSQNKDEERKEVIKHANPTKEDARQARTSPEKNNDQTSEISGSKSGLDDSAGNVEEALAAWAETEPESKMAFDVFAPPNGSQTANTKVDADLTDKAPIDMLANLKKTEESAATAVADLYTDTLNDDFTYRFRADSLKNSNLVNLQKTLQGKVVGVTTEQIDDFKSDLLSKRKLNNKQALAKNARQSLGYFNADSTVQARAEVNDSQKRVKDQAQGVYANASEKQKRAFDLPDSLTRTITGLVTDDEGEPLSGVSVQVKGTSIGAFTKTDGTYSLITDNSQTGSILFRYLGYSTMEIDLKKQSVLNVAISPSMMSVSEVVVSEFSPSSEEDEDEEGKEEGTSKNHTAARPIYGKKALNDHINENLIYPAAATAQNIKGRVLVEFTVAVNGDLKDFKILKGLGYGCDEEAIRLIKTGPRWQARIWGIDERNPVESRVKVRIRFKP